MSCSYLLISQRCQMNFNTLWLLLCTIAGKVHCISHWLCSGLSSVGFCMLPTLASSVCFLHSSFSNIHYLMLEQAEQGFFFVGKHYTTLLKQKLQTLIGDEEPMPQTVEVVMGRTLQVLTTTQSSPIKHIFAIT